MLLREFHKIRYYLISEYSLFIAVYFPSYNLLTFNRAISEMIEYKKNATSSDGSFRTITVVWVPLVHLQIIKSAVVSLSTISKTTFILWQFCICYIIISFGLQRCYDRAGLYTSGRPIKNYQNIWTPPVLLSLEEKAQVFVCAIYRS